MTLEKKKIETLDELPFHNGFLYSHISPEEGNLFFEQHKEEEIEFVLYPLPTPMPVEDFLALPESAPFELIHNQPIFMAAPKKKHQKVSFNLTLSLGGFVEDKQLGEIYYSPFDVHLPEGNVIQPDLLFVSKEKVEHLQENGLHTAPDWATEILSPSTSDKDENFKLQLLSENGTVEYWIIHPAELWVEQYIFDEETKKLLLHKKYEDENEVIESVVISGFSIALKKIFKGIIKK